MTYFWQEGYPIMVQVDVAGYPHYIAWDWFSGKHAILEIIDRWVVSDPWAEAWEKRNYYSVVTETGIALIIFFNRVTQEWYIQWVFD